AIRASCSFAAYTRKNRRAGAEAPARHASRCERLDLADVRGLQTFGSLRHVELHAITFGERLEAIALDRREVHEHILSTFLREESETLRLVEPLYCSGRHFETPCSP